MADMVTKKKLEDADIDVKHLGEAVNTKKVITPRAGAPFKSLPLIAEEYEKNGATRGFNTLAEFNAAKATLPAHIVVTIGEAGPNQGQNLWDGTTLSKSPFDPVAQSNKYTDDRADFRESTNLLDIVDKDNSPVLAITESGGLILSGIEETVQDSINATAGVLKKNVSKPLLEMQDVDGSPVLLLDGEGTLFVNDVVTQHGRLSDKLGAIDDGQFVDNGKLLKESDRIIAMRDTEARLDQVTLFTRDEFGAALTFAPSLCRLSKNKFLVVIEVRYGAGGDFDPVKIYGKYITVNSDYSLTVSDPTLIVDFAEVDLKTYGALNTCIVKLSGGVHAGRIYLYYLRMHDDTDQYACYIYSDDDGLTWSNEVDMTPYIPNAESWVVTAIGPGKAIQLQSGDHKDRIILPCWHGDLNYPISQAGLKSFVMYSDDGGVTYTIGGESQVSGSNECQVAELANGDFMLLTRDGSNFKNSEISKDGGLTFDGKRQITEITTTKVQSGFLQAKNHIDLSTPKLIVSTPSIYGQRLDLGLYISYDEKKFSFLKKISIGSASYSDMAQIDESNLLVVYSGETNFVVNAITINLKSIFLGA